MIVLFHPRSTKPRSRRFPLSILSIAALLEGKEDYAIIDGNVERNPVSALVSLLSSQYVEILAVSVMPGPQMVAAMDACRIIRQRFPALPIVWGGYFPSLYPNAALSADYVDFVVRGQGEETFVELLHGVRSGGLQGVAGLSYKDASGKQFHTTDRPITSSDGFPWLPYHRLEAEKYILPTFLGRRTAVHQASIGCPYPCNFCGVVPVFGSRQKMDSPARTATILRHLKSQYAIDSIQFYDNNFFLKEDHAQELCDRLKSLKLNWWCEARIDILLRFSDLTLRGIREAGCRMIFFGAESGSDWVLREMKKHLTTSQTLELAARLRKFGIIPEFSFVIGNPKDPERDTIECLNFIRRLKLINPASEIIIQHYTPVPQREEMYGNVENQIQFPTTVEEWASNRWLNFTLRKDPAVSWLPHPLKQKIDNFELVLNSRWPTIQDMRLPLWGRTMLKVLSAWRYRYGIYARPFELNWMQRLIDLRKPKTESL